ncbi:MAG TPA: hypothetical protein VNW04_09515, partial [Puia sp.]|nr:hypothetical protein [Puia sp.]
MATYDKEWIIRYVDGELSPEELGLFEAAMQTDTSLATEVGLYRELKAVLGERLSGDPAREALTQRTNQLNKQYFGQGTFNTTPLRKIPALRWLSTVAAAACILVAVLLLWPGDNSRKLDQLGQTDMIGTTERGDQTDTLLQKAAIFFN